MNNALGMDDYLDPFHLHAKQPVRFNHFESLIKQSRRVDRNFRTHIPGWMLERSFRHDRSKFLAWRFAKWSARRGQNDTPNIGGILAFEALKNGIVLRIHRQNAHAFIVR